MADTLAFSVLAAFSIYAGLFFCRALYCALFPHLRDIPGPKSASLLYGNFKEIEGNPRTMDEWREKYGLIFRFRSLFNFSQIYTGDPKALSHVVFNTDVYQKAPSARFNMARFCGSSILSEESHEHERYSSVFSATEIRQLHHVFLDDAAQLRDIWAAQVTQENEAARIDVYPWMRKFAIDVIGHAGFHYNFNAMKPGGQTNDFLTALAQMLHSPKYYYYFIFRSAQDHFPILRWIPMPGSKMFETAKRKMFRICAEIVEESKAFIKVSGEKHASRDLLSTLIKANLGVAVREDRQLTDQEVVSHMSAILASGSESSSVGMSWELFALAANPRVQDKLRTEIRNLARRTTQPSMDELHALPYLDAFVRESMRLYSSINFNGRMATQDDVLPLSAPYVDKRGRVHHAIPVKKGQRIHIPILHVNTDKTLWGEDALEFRPERWEDIPDAANAIPGMWANILTFWAGPHACVGYRFALAEQKALIFTLLLSFELGLAVPKEDMSRISGLALGRPIVLSEREKGPQLPLIIKPYKG